MTIVNRRVCKYHQLVTSPQRGCTCGQCKYNAVPYQQQRVLGSLRCSVMELSVIDHMAAACTGCIRKNCAVGSFGTISEPDGLSSRIIYQMKAEIDIQNWVNVYENPTDTNWHIKAWTWDCILTPVPIRNFSLGRFQEYGLVVIMVIYPDTPSMSLHGLMHDYMPST